MIYHKKYCVTTGMEVIIKWLPFLCKDIKNLCLTGNILTKSGVEGMVVLRQCHRDFMQMELENLHRKSGENPAQERYCDE